MIDNLQGLLWFNEQFRAVFTKHKTRNKDEYYWFTKDVFTGIRQHRYYTIFEEAVIVQFEEKEYTVIELRTTYIKESVIQLVNIDDPTDIINFMGIDKPVIHGTPYLIQEQVTTQQYAR